MSTPSVRLETICLLGRTRRTAGRGSSESSLSSADRLLPVLKGDDSRDTWMLELKEGPGADFFSGTASRSAANARSISPRHFWSMSTIVSRSYRPPRPSWMDWISQGGKTSTAKPASFGVVSGVVDVVVVMVEGGMSDGEGDVEELADSTLKPGLFISMGLILSETGSFESSPRILNGTRSALFRILKRPLWVPSMGRTDE